jgi:anti-sigma factor ChrR (cupin superfamily)
MSCIQPGAVTPEDLIALLAGEASPVVTAHVQACPDCAAEARSYARIERRLSQALYRFDCPSAETIGDFQLDRLPAGERQRVAAHLIECPRCAEERRLLQAFLAEEPEPEPHRPGILVRLIASLIPPEPQLASAVRGSADTAVQTYRAGNLTITLELNFDRWRRQGELTGLVLRDDDLAPEGLSGTATLVPSADPASPLSTELEPTGFAFDAIPAGTYQIELTLGSQIVVVEDLRVGS